MKSPRLAFLMLLFILACGKDHSTTGNTPPSASISGIVMAFGAPEAGVMVTARGTGFEDSAMTGSDGRFTFDAVPPGEYTLTPSGTNMWPLQAKVAAPVPVTAPAVFIHFPLGFTGIPGRIRFYGLVLNKAGEPVDAVRFTAVSETGDTSFSANTNEFGLARLYPETGTVCRVLLHKPGYAYTFSPDSSVVAMDDSLLLRLYSAQYTGPELHSVSGRLNIPAGMEDASIGVALKSNGLHTMTTVDAAGRFAYRGLKDGDYILDVLAQRLIFDVVPFTIAGEDLTIPDIIWKNRATDYVMRGRVITSTGVPVQGVAVEPTSSDESGEFTVQYEIGRYDRKQKQTITLTPEKEGYTFTPPSLTLELAFAEGTLDSTITLPDFIAADYSGYRADNFFPLSAASTWTYSRTANSGSVADYTIITSGTVSINNQSFLTLSPEGPGGYTAFRLDGNSVRSVLNGKSVEFLRFGQSPGTSWSIGKAVEMYPLTGTFLGLESVSVPAGMFPDCLKFTVRKEYGSTTHETHTLWFAKDTGMVRSEKVTVNYGEERERVVDVLK